MLRVAPQIMAWLSPSEIAAGATALLVLVLCGLILLSRQKSFAAAAGRSILILVGAALSGALAWGALYSPVPRSQDTQRSALEVRAGQLAGQALIPGSPLACLDTLAGDTVQGACERVVFASPANVAMAISYVAAQFALLSDMTHHVRRGGAPLDDTVLQLQRTLEADPFGFLAQVLVVRDGCTADNCAALSLLPDPRHVRTNIIAQTLHQYLDHYRDVWARSSDTAVADAGGTVLPDADGLGTKRKVSADIDFPTAASIPPISIMNPEPKRDAAVEPTHKRESGAQTDPVWTPSQSPAAR
ncbi:MAG: hypothetical protein ACRECE_10905 [Xanthobacteraceae bacterium]